MSALPAPRHRPTAAPHLRVVPPPRPRHTLAYAVLILLVCAAAIFATVAFGALAAGHAVAAAELEREVAEAERRYAELVAEVAELEDPARIERVATERLGMVPADGARYLVLDRPLPDDDEEPIPAGGRADPLKPVLSVER
jgi:cell division protein FtsL